MTVKPGSAAKILYEMIDILNDEAIFPTGLISLVAANNQYDNFNATSFYFGSLRNQSVRKIRIYVGIKPSTQLGKQKK